MGKIKSVIVVDSSALISLFLPADYNHKRAFEISLQISKQNLKVLIPGEIITETINVFGKKSGHEKAVGFGQKILTSPFYIKAETTPIIRQNAFEKFKSQPESVSFTDCLVMAFADEQKTKDIFGFDEVFGKNGYTRLGFDKT